MRLENATIRWMHVAIGWFFVMLLFASALGKLLDMPGFYRVVDSYRALPGSAIAALAWSLALSELALGLWLLASQTKRHWRVAASTAVLGLHLLYLAWLSVAFARGLNVPNCGCFGVFFPRPLAVRTFVEDGFLIVLAIVLLLSAKHVQPSPSSRHGPRTICSS